jgi:hypothetical protein
VGCFCLFDNLPNLFISTVFRFLVSVCFLHREQVWLCRLALLRRRSCTAELSCFVRRAELVWRKHGGAGRSRPVGQILRAQPRRVVRVLGCDWRKVVDAVNDHVGPLLHDSDRIGYMIVHWQDQIAALQCWRLTPEAIDSRVKWIKRFAPRIANWNNYRTRPMCFAGSADWPLLSAGSDALIRNISLG